MRDLPDSIKSRPLNQIHLPGSHDSAAYYFNLSATPSLKTPMMNWAINIARREPIIAGLIQRTTLTQKLTLMQQLEQGVRALDLRIFYNQALKAFYLAHSIASIPLDSALEQIQAFLKVHPTELLLVQMQPDAEHSENHQPYQEQALDKIEITLSSLLVPRLNKFTFNQTLTMRDLLAKKYQILWSTTLDPQRPRRAIWPTNAFNTYWPNSQNTTESLDRIVDYIQELESGNQLNLVFFTVTPTQDSLIAAIVGYAAECDTPDSLIEWSELMNRASIEYINNASRELKSVNIISSDAPSDELIQKIIELNFHVPAKPAITG